MGETMRIAILDDYNNVALKLADWSPVLARAELVSFDDHLDDLDALVARLSGFDVIVIMRGRTHFPRRLLERLQSLKLIVSTGMRHIAVDMDAATERGIVVYGTGGAANGPVAVELAWALILGLARKLPMHDRSIREGGWQREPGISLRGKVLGIVGLGLIGAQVARIGRAFGMDVIAWSQNLTPERCAEAGVRYADKDALLGAADVVSIHLTLSDRTRGLIGARELGLMKPGALLINTSRGPIVDQTALIDALQSRRIRGAALDVYDIEPLPADHPMRGLPHSVLTPHLGFVTEENFRVYYSQCIENVLAFLDGAPIRVLNPEVLESAA
jgi:phosphoglycerate dehydrogenase-like enzyme